MVGILVHGNNHYILSGPRPTAEEAAALARNWLVVQIGEAKSQKFEKWEIRNKEFRENLEWAVMMPGDRDTWPRVLELLAPDCRKGRGDSAVSCSRHISMTHCLGTHNG